VNAGEADDLALAEAALAEAKLMAEEGMWKSVVNAAYNAGYFAVSAALKEIGESPKTHAELRKKFVERMVGREGLGPDCGYALDALFGAKARSGSSVGIEWSRETVESLLESGELLVSAIRERRMGK
jgi:uncharacterized protein (UPF0332 family)